MNKTIMYFTNCNLRMKEKNTGIRIDRCVIIQPLIILIHKGEGLVGSFPETYIDP